MYIYTYALECAFGRPRASVFVRFPKRMTNHCPVIFTFQYQHHQHYQPQNNTRNIESSFSNNIGNNTFTSINSSMNNDIEHNINNSINRTINIKIDNNINDNIDKISTMTLIMVIMYH